MDIDTAIRRLKSLGLYVERHVPGAMTDRAPSDGLTIARARMPQDGLHHLDDICFVFVDAKGIMFPGTLCRATIEIGGLQMVQLGNQTMHASGRSCGN